MQKNIVVGILAHVDAGKTTLSEGLLFQGGSLRKLGRVDHQNAFLDTNEIERKRGITIFSKQAVLPLKETIFTFLDTPGHVDFSTEMERTLQVLDYAVLIISASDGVQGHTITLWNLLAKYNIPTFLFVNKMDLPGTDHRRLLTELKTRFDDNCISFSDFGKNDFYDSIATCDEDALSQFLDKGKVSENSIISLIRQRLLFPCFFGAALRLEGVTEFLNGLEKYTTAPQYPMELGAKVYKITRDHQNNRLTHLKITGGKLKVRDSITNQSSASSGQDWTEKINQIRIYSGEKYTAVDEVASGTICAVTGLSQSYAGQGIGIESASPPPTIEPVLSFRLLLPKGCNVLDTLLKLRQLEEEDPQIKISWVEQAQEIYLHLMGEIQLEIIQSIISDRFGIEVEFDAGNILYRETIAKQVVGMGHFEPLRHYAEVHLLLEPAPTGSGLKFETVCSEDDFPRSWQRLVLTHLGEREHLGVLTGSPITDMKITLLAGRAHNKHTVGGDFRQATYRAIRQGLMQAENVLLEPWYRFQLEIPNDLVGRAMNDLQRISNDVSLPEVDGERTILKGTAPVSAVRDYAGEVITYTHGLGRFFYTFSGFAPCHNQKKPIAKIGYDPEHDAENPADSVFCSNGSGFTVKWNRAKDFMHLDSSHFFKSNDQSFSASSPQSASSYQERATDFELDEELKKIYERTYGPIKRKELVSINTLRPIRKSEYIAPKRNYSPKNSNDYIISKNNSEYLLVDGYNIIHAWDDLRNISEENMEAARQILMDILSNYKGYRGCEVILIFDAYKVPGGLGSIIKYHNIEVVYTKENETADEYIEKKTYEIGNKYRVTVATSDGDIQRITFGRGALRISPQMLKTEIAQVNSDIKARIGTTSYHGFESKITIE